MDIEIDKNCEWNGDRETLTFPARVNGIPITLVVPFIRLLDPPPFSLSGLEDRANFNDCDKEEVLKENCLSNMEYLKQALEKRFSRIKITVEISHW